MNSSENSVNSSHRSPVFGTITDSKATELALLVWCNCLRPTLLERVEHLDLSVEIGAADPDRMPVVCLFIMAYHEKCHTLAKLLDRMPSVVDREFLAVLRDTLELDNILFPRSSADHDAEGAREFRLQVAEGMTMLGLDFAYVSKVINKKRKRGAPSDPWLSLTGLELKEKGCSYRYIAEHICICGKPKHDSHCVDAIRKRIKGLEPLFRKYCRLFDIPLPLSSVNQ